MAIRIEEKFQVKSSIDTVWRFLMDPQGVVTCMPGAELEEVVDDRTFLGNTKVKVGPISISYKGQVRFTEVNEEAHTVQMVAEGRETGGGMAKGTMFSRLQALPDGQTEVTVEADIDVTGRIMQFSRGMIQDVSKQLFQQFVECARKRLEAPAEAAAEAPVAAPETEPIPILPLAVRAVWGALVRLFRRLLGQASA